MRRDKEPSGPASPDPKLKVPPPTPVILRRGCGSPSSHPAGVERVPLVWLRPPGDRFGVAFLQLIYTNELLQRSLADQISVTLRVPTLWYAGNAALAACAMLGVALAGGGNHVNFKASPCSENTPCAPQEV